MNFLLIFLDTLRFDHLGCYGYPLDTSPNIDRIADESVLFERAYPTDVPTQPSFTSTFTGQPGITSGVVSHADHEWLDEKSPWLPSILERNSYATAAVSTLFNMKEYFAKGFNYYMNAAAGTRNLTQRVTADDINSYAIPWIDSHAGEDFLLFVHYWDIHEYKPGKDFDRMFYEGDECDPDNDSLSEARKSGVWPFLERKIDTIGKGITDAEYIRCQYDAAIRYVDDRVSRLLDAVREKGVLDETLLVITADHGESLGEHKLYFDHAGVYEPTIHIPLLIRWPEAAVRRSTSLVQNIDLAPTILDLAGIEIPEDIEGKSLIPLMRGERERVRDVVYANQGAWQAKRAMVTDRWKYIRCIDHGFWPCPDEELYDIQNDPKELNELSSQRPEILDEYALRLRRWEEGQLGRRIDPLIVAAERGLPPYKWVYQLVNKEGLSYPDWRMQMGG